MKKITNIILGRVKNEGDHIYEKLGESDESDDNNEN